MNKTVHCMSVATILFIPAIASAVTPEVDIPDMHSIQDWLQPNPVLDALDAGVTSLEVDIHRVGSELLLGNSVANATANQFTLWEYFDILASLEDPPEIRLVLDAKTANYTGQIFFDILDGLEDYPEFEDGFIEMVYTYYTISLASLERPDYLSFSGNGSAPSLSNPDQHLQIVQWQWSVAPNANASTIAAVDTLMTNVHGAGKEILFTGLPAAQADLERPGKFYLKLVEILSMHLLFQPISRMLGISSKLTRWKWKHSYQLIPAMD